jgi:nucleoside diphosphate kinase
MGSFTFSYLKPHLIRAGGAGILKQIIQEAGFRIVHEEEKNLDMDTIIRLYPHITSQYPDDFHLTETALSNTSGLSIMLVLWNESNDAAYRLRKLIGAPRWHELPEGKGIRGTYALGRYQNAIHGSDSELDALQEIQLCIPQAVDTILHDSFWRDEFYTALERNFPKEGKELDSK